MIYITGDTHGDFSRIELFTRKFRTEKDDILIILGDAGINYGGEVMDKSKKNLLGSLPITLFCIHGNHEMRPQIVPGYKEAIWHGGTVYVEDDYPNLLFAKDGEIYEINGLKAIVIGGAYSIDKYYRIAYGYRWFADEQPSEEIRANVEKKLDSFDWKLDVVLSHTAPLKYEPVEMFLSGIDQSRVDKSTEQWLDEIEDKLTYQKWYLGHYHTEKKIDRVEIMFQTIGVFSEK